jgi:DivIVA domain-containing protein
MGKKDKTTGTAPATASSRLTPMDIQQKEFRVSRFGGYKMRDVDEFLDQITDTFTSLSAEIDRLRAAGGAAPVLGSPDLDDVSRQADEIIARARAEAARITAEARAAGTGAAAGAGGSQDRAGVNAFIVRERAFLQSLAGLVQEHAETVKDMARSSRRAPAVPASTESAPPPEKRPDAATKPATTPIESRKGETSPEGTTEPATAGEPAAEEASKHAPQPAVRLPEGEDTVRIEEPATAGATRSDGDPESDRSLRDLFWGED